jgi:hypothetical protein
VLAGLARVVVVTVMRVFSVNGFEALPLISQIAVDEKGLFA